MNEGAEGEGWQLRPGTSTGAYRTSMTKRATRYSLDLEETRSRRNGWLLGAKDGRASRKLYQIAWSNLVDK